MLVPPNAFCQHGFVTVRMIVGTTGTNSAATRIPSNCVCFCSKHVMIMMCNDSSLSLAFSRRSRTSMDHMPFAGSEFSASLTSMMIRVSSHGAFSKVGNLQLQTMFTLTIYIYNYNHAYRHCRIVNVIVNCNWKLPTLEKAPTNCWACHLSHK